MTAFLILNQFLLIKDEREKLVQIRIRGGENAL
jgi:hypothetical protein